MKLNVRRNALSNITSYASYPSTVGFLFHADHKTNPSMLGTLDSSCSQVSTRQMISISLGIQLIIGPLCYNPNLHHTRLLGTMPSQIPYLPKHC
jgi:hypothetical protein